MTLGYVWNDWKGKGGCYSGFGIRVRYYECSKSAPQEALRALRTAWDRCFKKTAGVPKFKKKGRSDNFTLEGVVKIIGNNKIQVPKIGVLKTYERLPQVATKSVIISRTADKWFS